MRLRCGPDRFQASVVESRGGLQVILDGRPHELDLRELAPGSFLLYRDGRSEIFHCVRDGDDVHLFWRGTVFRLSEEREGGASVPRPGAGSLEAPMPGKVIKVSVAAGQQVAKGEEILVIEAMKMENAVRAPRDGRVKSIAAKEGDMVGPGTVLVEIE